MLQPIRGQGGNLGFSIGRKNTNLIEGVEDLLPVKFRQNPFSGCEEEAEKMFQPIRGQGGHLGFSIGTKNTNLIEGVENLLPVKFRQNPFSGCGEAEKCFSQSEARASILDIRSARKTQT